MKKRPSAQRGNTLIFQRGNTLIFQRGNTLIFQRGSTLIFQRGSTLIFQRGSTLIFQRGSTLIFQRFIYINKDIVSSFYCVFQDFICPVIELFSMFPVSHVFCIYENV